MLRRMRWTPDCRMGDEHIDAQHRLLFAIANELLEIDDPEEERESFGYLFAHMRHYIETHFADEEKLMESYNYEFIEDHVKKHKHIVSEINEVVKKSPDLQKLRNNLYYMFDNWIKMHILKEDAEFFNWLERKQKK